MLSPMYLLIVSNRLKALLTIELGSSTYSKLLRGWMTSIGPTNKGFGNKEFYNSFTLSLKKYFSFSISSIEYFGASPFASWNLMNLEGVTLCISIFEFTS
jgi:hypothetical protein